MEHDLDILAAMQRGHADFAEQIRLSRKAIERSQQLLRRADEQLAKPPLKP